MNRKLPAQRPPHPQQDLSEFPTTQVSGPVWRAHQKHLSPWWFASDDAGRFTLPPPAGTLYAAETVEIAVRERLADLLLISNQTISETMSTTLAVSQLSFDSPLACADLSHDHAARHNVTRELSTTTDYALSREWASRLHSENHDGITYLSRFSSGSERAVAIFGDAGEHSVGEIVATISGAEACEDAGISILSTPPSRNVHFIDPPDVQKRRRYTITRRA